MKPQQKAGEEVEAPVKELQEPDIMILHTVHVFTDQGVVVMPFTSRERALNFYNDPTNHAAAFLISSQPVDVNLEQLNFYRRGQGNTPYKYKR